VGVSLNAPSSDIEKIHVSDFSLKFKGKYEVSITQLDEFILTNLTYNGNQLLMFPNGTMKTVKKNEFRDDYDSTDTSYYSPELIR